MPRPVLTVLSRIPWWLRLSAVALLAALAAVVVVDTASAPTPVPPRAAGDADQTTTPPPEPDEPHVPVPAVPAERLASLPEASTYTTLSAAPRDTDAAADTDGLVVHNTEPLPVFTAPGGQPFARLPVRQVGSDTWLPVVGEQPGWLKVLLPSKPNGGTGWLDASRLRHAHTVYQIRVNLADTSLRLLRDGKAVGRWTVGIGKDDTPTPAGRTFLLASIKDSKQNYSPVILPLGSHSSTLDTFGGGPGTVAIHSWPTNDVFGKRLSHGSIRVPADALGALLSVPLGTLVLITNT